MTMRSWWWGGTIGLGSFLLFSVEPMAAKQLLPVLGGSSAVWLTCLCFFQVMLLVAYGYAYWLRAGMTLRRASGVHLGVLGVGVFSLVATTRGTVRGSGAHPAVAIFVTLLISIGVPFFLLGTTTPLLQAWFALVEKRAVPYGWFALSNLSSLLALLAYPLWIEPHLTLRTQRLVWAGGFGIYAVLCGLLTLRMREGGEVAEAGFAAIETKVSTGRRVLWFVLAAVGAVQLSSVTSHLTANVAAIPLLWVVPLVVYLLSFVVAFEFAGLYRRWLVMRVLTVLLASLGYLLSKTGVGLPIELAIAFFVAELFVACWFLHAELYALRPVGSRAATEFYLVLAAGGAAGTFFVAIVSPVVFRANYDVPLAFAMTAAAALAVTWESGWQQRMLWGVGTALACVLLMALRVQNGQDAVVRVRNFYGTLTVRETHTPAQAVTARMLVHGSIQHGLQWFADDYRRRPMSYYAEDSGAGLAVGSCCGERPRRIGVIGLGAGTMAAYGRAGDVIEFYEINPAVERVARETFTYMRDAEAAGAQVSVVTGDARISLAGQAAQGFDVLVVDAFSGDAIPVHLLTAEAMTLYRRHLAAGGVIAFHVSNQYLRLPPVIARLAEAQRMTAREVESVGRAAQGSFDASWVLVSEREAFFAVPQVARAITPVSGRAALWTDDYSSLLPLVRWERK